MQYRRIQDLEETIPSSSIASGHHSTSTSSRTPQDTRKRKLSNAFDHSWQHDRGFVRDLDNEVEDEIHLFRRVHIRARKRVEWSRINKSPFLIVHGPGFNRVGLVNRMSSSYGDKAAAVHADRPFDRRFCYFEIRIVHVEFADDDYSDG